MSELGELTKAKKPKEQLIELDGLTYMVKGMGRSAKNKFYNEFQRDDGTWNRDADLFEAKLLSACVYDPSSGEQVLPNHEDWNGIDPMITGPLVELAQEFCGLNKKEVDRVKKLEPVEG